MVYMNFYYDPIKGLQYNFFEPNVWMDIGEVPKISTKEAIKLMHQRGVLLVNSSNKAIVETLYRITNYITL